MAAQTVLRGVLALFYGAAGVLHIAAADKFLLITPGWVPWARTVIVVTGLCEIAGAAALLTPRWRRLAGIMLGAYAVCVFPANIKHAMEGITVPGLPSTWWYHGPRLLFQPVLVWAALFAGDVVRWPFGRAAAAQSERRA